MKVKTSILLSVFVSVLVLCGITGCASAPAAPIGNATGTATASAPGFGGDVTVTITMAGGYITDVVCKGDFESPTIGGPAIIRAPNIIKRYNSANIDTISGATITTMALSEATQKAIDEILGK